MPAPSPAHRAVAVAAFALMIRHAAAGPTVTAELPAAVPVSQPQAETFRPGVLPALGVYQAVAPRLAVGLRARLGVLGDGAAPMDGRADPGWGGLATIALAIRIDAGHPWLELAGGGGVTGADRVPVLEVGVGWSTRFGATELGPALRYLRVHAAGGGPALGSADLALAGLEMRWGGAPPRRRPRAPVIAAPRPTPTRVATAPRDHDRLIDTAPGCAADPTACGGIEPDGETLVDVLEACSVMSDALGRSDACAAGGDIEVGRDRIILAEQVLFKVGRARVRRAARPVVRAIAAAWTRGDWQRLIIEGHADVRGDAAFNLWLSRLRAERARAALIAAGVPAAAIEAVGYGSTRPRASTHDDNRRVEFVIVPRPRPAETP